jgi:hypothetical protein
MNSKNKSLVWVGLVIGFIFVSTFATLQLFGENKYKIFKEPTGLQVSDFKQCKSAKDSVVVDSTPPQCVFDGKVYKDISADVKKSEPTQTTAKPTETQTKTPNPNSTKYTSVNFPSLTINYPNDWKITKDNLNFPNNGQPNKKDDNGTEMITGLIKLTKDKYEIEYKVTPIWDFGGYGPGIACFKKDVQNKIFDTNLGRFNVTSNDSFGDKNFTYTYEYFDKLILPSNPEFNSYFDEKNIAISIPGPSTDYEGCVGTSLQTGAYRILSNYTQNGKKINANVTIKFKINGQSIDSNIFPIVDDIVLSNKA